MKSFTRLLFINLFNLIPKFLICYSCIYSLRDRKQESVLREEVI